MLISKKATAIYERQEVWGKIANAKVQKSEVLKIFIEQWTLEFNSNDIPAPFVSDSGLLFHFIKFNMFLFKSKILIDECFKTLLHFHIWFQMENFFKEMDYLSEAY